MGLKRLYLPFDEKLPLLEIENLEFIFVNHLQDVLQHLNGKLIPVLDRYKQEENASTIIYPDFQQIIGHSYAKHALEVAAAGEHNLFMSGPPGCGKSLLAENFPSILPPLSKESWLEMMSIYQLSGMSNPSNLPPFRNPHHSSS